MNRLTLTPPPDPAAVYAAVAGLLAFLNPGEKFKTCRIVARTADGRPVVMAVPVAGIRGPGALSAFQRRVVEFVRSSPVPVKRDAIVRDLTGGRLRRCSGRNAVYLRELIEGGRLHVCGHYVTDDLAKVPAEPGAEPPAEPALRLVAGG